MEHRRNLKRKRGHEADRRRNKLGQDINSQVNVNRGLSYRPLSRPAADRSTRDCFPARTLPDRPINRGDYEDGQRPSEEFHGITSITPSSLSSVIDQFPLHSLASYPPSISLYPMPANQSVERYSDVGGY